MSVNPNYYPTNPDPWKTPNPLLPQVQPAVIFPPIITTAGTKPKEDDVSNHEKKIRKIKELVLELNILVSEL